MTQLTQAFLYALTSLLLLSCTKETVIEKNITPERQATSQIKDSFSDISTNQITISKSSLGKAFILIPTAVSSGQHPDIDYLKPLIISFEKSGSRIALFNLTEDQLYSTIPSSRLLQTFDISSENEKTVTLNLSTGFTSFNEKQNLGIISKTIFDEMKKNSDQGNESSLEVKESYVRYTESSEGSLFIEQVMRLKKQSLTEKKNPSDPNAKPNLILQSVENSATYVFEIKPYFNNPTFNAKVYDKEQRVGYFLNFAVKEQQDEPVPQITKWDIADSRGPIIVRLHNKTPTAVISSISEGVLYWNLAFGKEVLKIGNSFESRERQLDRTIHIFWIPWDSAGFARAGFQADPLTGEIFRGQVFMTSSWYKDTKEKFKLHFGTKDLIQESNPDTCVLDQSKLSDFEVSDLSAAGVEKATQDTVRDVIAHEMGHALGLRHNFSGSSTTDLTDVDFLNAKNNYRNGNTSGLVAPSTTVMDYTNGTESAMSGAYILHNVLPYDKAAIQWGYLNQESNMEKYKYCSDEHITLADAAKKTVYGCERFDSFNNVLQGNVDTEKRILANKASQVFKNIISDMTESRSNYSNSKKFENILKGIAFSFSTYSLDNMIYLEPSANYYTIETVIDGLLPEISGHTLTTTDFSVTAKFQKDAAALGGLSGLIERILDPEKNTGNNVYEKQTLQFFERIDYADYQDLFSKDEFEQIKKSMLENAKISDIMFLVDVLKSFPITKTTYAFDPVSKESKASQNKVSVAFGLGNVDLLIARYLSAYEVVMPQISVQGNVLGTEKTYFFYQPDSYYWEFLTQLFKPSLISSPLGLPHAEKLKNGLEKMKLLSVGTTVEILQSLGLVVSMPVTSVQLTTLVDQVDWTKITGVTKVMLQNQIAELKKWETLN